MIVISTQDHADCTAEVSARYSVAIPPLASLAAICSKARVLGVNYFILVLLLYGFLP
jgi:hypothetical protein